jgi:hypothetical protein
MSTIDPLPLPPIFIDDADAKNTGRLTLTRDGVAALFAQSSYDTVKNPTTDSSRSTVPTVAAQRSSLFRFVIQRSTSFAIPQVIPNTRRNTLKPIRSICNQHDSVSSFDIDIEPVASITNCLQAPSIAAVQICRSISMPDTSNKYHQKRLLIEGGGKPI